jgi:hypothetical protein
MLSKIWDFESASYEEFRLFGPAYVSEECIRSIIGMMKSGEWNWRVMQQEREEGEWW